MQNAHNYIMVLTNKGQTGAQIITGSHVLNSIVRSPPLMWPTLMQTIVDTKKVVALGKEFKFLANTVNIGLTKVATPYDKTWPHKRGTILIPYIIVTDK